MNTIQKKKRKDMVLEISNMHSIEHEEIFKIILEHDINYTKNNNGVFINLSKVNDDIIDKIQERITFYQKNSEYLDKCKQMRETYK